MEIIPTVVPDTLDDVKAAHLRYAFTGALHIDVSDGVFAPRTTWMPAEGERLPESEGFRYGVHLMVQEPLAAGVPYIRAGARRINAHIEAFDNAEQARDCARMWRMSGTEEIGIAVLLETPLARIDSFLEIFEYVVFMSIAEIGSQGAPFDERVFDRLKEFKTKHPHVLTAVDGGVSVENIGALTRAGAERFFVGAALARAADPRAAYEALVAAAKTV